MKDFSRTEQILLLIALILLGIHIIVSFIAFCTVCEKSLPPKLCKSLWAISFVDVTAAFVLVIIAVCFNVKSDDDETYQQPSEQPSEQSSENKEIVI
jgi:predicted acyltransferase